MPDEDQIGFTFDGGPTLGVFTLTTTRARTRSDPGPNFDTCNPGTGSNTVTNCEA